MAHQSALISADIDAYLARHEQKELLRLLTCGSVDDGKSTLIGRLLHDSRMIYEDQLAELSKDSVKSGTAGAEVDLALLVDGLQAEREQGITIDVAYRYFSTAERKFIIADTPGHEQYTRNMATGASTSDLAIILIDARHGVQTQTRRHSVIASLLGIRHIIVAVNKMDLVGYDERVFNRIKADYLDFAARLDRADPRFIPISALKGDNVVERGAALGWHEGPPLMAILNGIEIAADRNLADMRLPVQYVNRPNPDFRGYCGALAGGVVRPGDRITALPSGRSSTVKSIVTYDGELAEAHAPMSVTLTLQDEIDISRGDMLAPSANLPETADRFRANIVWMSEQPLVAGKQYDIKLASRMASGTVAEISHRIDVNSLAEQPATALCLNEIGHCEVALNAPVSFDPYKKCKGTGSFIIIDRLSNVTVGAGMITGSGGDARRRPVTPEERRARYGQQGFTAWLAGAHSLAVARELERRLFDMGHLCHVLDQTQTRLDLEAAARLLSQAGLICLGAIDQEARAPKSGQLFDCDARAVDDILQAISQGAGLR